MTTSFLSLDTDAGCVALIRWGDQEGGVGLIAAVLKEYFTQNENTHPDAEGGSGEVSPSTKLFCRSFKINKYNNKQVGYVVYTL